MRITGLYVDGFGVWSGLELTDLAQNLIVFYGPNEAGKTTLMQFVRAMFHGYSADCARRYLPPVQGGTAGGKLSIASPAGRFDLIRPAGSGGRIDADDDVRVVAADGTIQGEHQLRLLLSGVDEAIYNNVFAVGLHEIQELGTLGESEAAELLYGLSAGLDRVSLVEVMRGLAGSRSALLAEDDGPSQITALMQRRTQQQETIEQLKTQTRRYGRLAHEQALLDEQIESLDRRSQELQGRLKLVDLAAGLTDRWQEKQQIERQLAETPAGPDVPVELLDSIRSTDAALEKRRTRLAGWRRRRGRLRRRARSLSGNPELARHTPRIEALCEQQPWIESLGQQTAALAEEVRLLELESAGAASSPRAGDDASISAGATRPAVSALRPLGRRLREVRRAASAAEAAADKRRRQADKKARELQSAMSASGTSDVTATLEQKGNEIAQLRRRLQLDGRIEELRHSEQELDEKRREWMHRQVLPGWVVVTSAGVFALGVLLIAVGFLLPQAQAAGWPLGVLGLSSVSLALIYKFFMERAADRDVQRGEQHAELLRQQIAQAEEEREQLDRQIPPGGGPLAVRLSQAEKELAALEPLLPLETGRRAAGDDARAAEAQAEQARGELRIAQKKWRSRLVQAGLPPDTRPRDLAGLAARSRRAAELSARLADCRRRWQQCHGEFDAVTQRIDALAQQVGVPVEQGAPLATLRRLSETVAEQQAVATQYESIRRRFRRQRRNIVRCRRSIESLTVRRQVLLHQAGLTDPAQVESLAEQFAYVSDLRSRQEAIDAKIAAAIAGKCSLQALAGAIGDGGLESLERQYDTLTAQNDAITPQIRVLHEQRGQLRQELDTLAADRQLAEARLDLAAIGQQIDDAIARWQVIAVTESLLDGLRRQYETLRQPETLQEASGYLQQLTDGRYRRVWTPLGEQTLRVDDASGNALPIEVLSRGTREQLFLSLRLALAASYARRGAILPLVLDDVLVNFDVRRATLAARVLRDFAKVGHQILLFTCHEHIQKIFKSLKTEVRTLPDCSLAAVPAARKTKAAKKTKVRAVDSPEPALAPTAAEPEIETSDAIPELEAEDAIAAEPLEIESEADAREDEDDADVAAEEDVDEAADDEEEEEIGDDEDYEDEEEEDDEYEDDEYEDEEEAGEEEEEDEDEEEAEWVEEDEEDDAIEAELTADVDDEEWEEVEDIDAESEDEEGDGYWFRNGKPNEDDAEAA